MKTEVLSYMLKNTYKLTHIPILITDKETVTDEFHASKWFYMKAYYDKLLNTEEAYNLYLTKQSLAFGLLKYENLTIIFGPVKTVPLNTAMIREILLDNDFHLEEAKNLTAALDYIPTMQLEYFAALMSSNYTNINHEIILADDFLSKVQYEHSEMNFDNLLLQKQSQIVFGNKMPHNTYEYEQKMLYCVKNGLVKDLHKLGHLSTDQNVDVVVSDTLRHYKNLVMAQKTLISRAAIEGGVEAETAYSLSDIYSHKIESCQTLNQISELSYSIRDTYCKMVRDLKYPKINDLIITKAITYINKNITESITASDIAAELGISREYLSSKFTKVMGQTVSEFVNEQKIAIAKKLLKFSDKPLIAISNYLSYSSQSYFQIQFKKVTGMTPLEYRNTKTT